MNIKCVLHNVEKLVSCYLKLTSGRIGFLGDGGRESFQLLWSYGFWRRGNKKYIEVLCSDLQTECLFVFKKQNKYQY